jgi:hypothetical protein
MTRGGDGSGQRQQCHKLESPIISRQETAGEAEAQARRRRRSKRLRRRRRSNVRSSQVFLLLH